MKLKLTQSQARKLENACINGDGSTAAEVAQELGRPVIRCPQCQETNGIYPHILHMEKAHGVTNYFKSIINLNTDE